MKGSKIINLVGKGRTVSLPLTFPLSEQTLSDIETLKLAFRNSFEQHRVYSLGMAAPQIDVYKRFFIMPKDFRYGQITDFKRLQRTVRQFDVYINPKVLTQSEQLKTMNEYCLSVGFNQYRVTRARQVEVSYWNEKGEQLKGKLDELRSRVFQHEYDHLDGLLMTEHPSAKIVMRGTGRNIRK